MQLFLMSYSPVKEVKSGEYRKFNNKKAGFELTGFFII